MAPNIPEINAFHSGYFLLDNNVTKVHFPYLPSVNMKKPPLMQRLRAKKQAKHTIISVTWYANADVWLEMKSAATDPDRFESTYEEWQSVVNEAIAEFEKNGHKVIKYNVVPSEYFAWCLAQGKERNAASRAEFVAQKNRSMH